ncbi:MAG: type II toxin-antitoxin system VapC family toxin [Acidimicrobiia bacterium]
MVIWYVDTSAVVKLIRKEPETAALRRWLRGKRWIGSDLLHTKLGRAVLRGGGPSDAQRAERLLREIDLITLSPELYDAARDLEPATLRSLDAIHLTAALSLVDDLSGVVAYDSALLDAARAVGGAVVAPGAQSGSR